MKCKIGLPPPELCATEFTSSYSCPKHGLITSPNLARSLPTSCAPPPAGAKRPSRQTSCGGRQQRRWTQTWKRCLTYTHHAGPHEASPASLWTPTVETPFVRRPTLCWRATNSGCTRYGWTEKLPQPYTA